MLGITKFSGWDELKLRHLCDIVVREKTHVNEKQGKNNVEKSFSWKSNMDKQDGIFSRIKRMDFKLEESENVQNATRS